jgi:hypothetical protein
MDWDFLLRAAAAGFRFARMPRFVGCFRIHDAQKTSAWLDRGLAEQAVLRARWVDPDWTWSDIHHGIANYVLRQHAYHQAWRLGLSQLSRSYEARSGDCLPRFAPVLNYDPLVATRTPAE